MYRVGWESTVWGIATNVRAHVATVAEEGSVADKEWNGVVMDVMQPRVATLIINVFLTLPHHPMVH